MSGAYRSPVDKICNVINDNLLTTQVRFGIHLPAVEDAVLISLHPFQFLAFMSFDLFQPVVFPWMVLPFKIFFCIVHLTFFVIFSVFFCRWTVINIYSLDNLIASIRKIAFVSSSFSWCKHAFNQCGGKRDDLQWNSKGNFLISDAVTWIWTYWD